MTLLQFFTGFGITIATVVCTCIAPFYSIPKNLEKIDRDNIDDLFKVGLLAISPWLLTSLALGICISIIIFSR